MTVFLIALVMSLVIQVTFYVLAVLNKSDKFSDLAYGLNFVVISFVYWLLSGATFIQTLTLFMVSLWGLRLAGYSFSRVLKIKKPARFGQQLFQAVTVWLVLLPTLFILNYTNSMSVSIFTWIGLVVWLLGVALESFADLEKAVFKTIPENADKWTNTGLWKYSRHPNYFGEILCWWGIFIVSLPFISGIYWLVICGPVFITLLLVFVTGIPPTEKKNTEKYAGNLDYQKYRSQTHLLIPWPHKKPQLS